MSKRSIMLCVTFEVEDGTPSEVIEAMVSGTKSIGAYVTGGILPESDIEGKLKVVTTSSAAHVHNPKDEGTCGHCNDYKYEQTLLPVK